MGLIFRDVYRKIGRTKRLLKQSARSIADIALLCSFKSHSHLSKKFRQMKGTTPKAYRIN
ncbi:helix-turn-helix domain-containing protein [Phormidesmis sp. 146-12]